LSLIENYEIVLSTPECDLESPIYRASVSLSSDISEVLPYFNATVEKGEFIPGIPVLTWTENSHKYALRAKEVAISNIADRDEAQKIVASLVERINSIWEKKDKVKPSFESYERPKILEILKLLPRTNCKECGLATCMAFADSLAKGKKELGECPPLGGDECADKLTLLRDMGL
jgi:ArsR family metal-binding transcriptional regulator